MSTKLMAFNNLKDFYAAVDSWCADKDSEDIYYFSVSMYLEDGDGWCVLCNSCSYCPDNGYITLNIVDYSTAPRLMRDGSITNASVSLYPNSTIYIYITPKQRGSQHEVSTPISSNRYNAPLHSNNTSISHYRRRTVPRCILELRHRQMESALRANFRSSRRTNRGTKSNRRHRTFNRSIAYFKEARHA